MLTREYVEGLEQVAVEAPHLRGLGPERLREAISALAAEGWTDLHGYAGDFVRGYIVGLELLVQDLEDDMEVTRP